LDGQGKIQAISVKPVLVSKQTAPIIYLKNYNIMLKIINQDRED
jgi:hypothetical protein